MLYGTNRDKQEFLDEALDTESTSNPPLLLRMINRRSTYLRGCHMQARCAVIMLFCRVP